MNTQHLALVKLVICGPKDVAKEIEIVKSVVENWNQLNGESRGLCVKHHHWLTDVYPDLASRAQEVPNHQIIDPAKILVAVFWSRFGTATGVAGSGTQEEILRAADQRKKVMVYFSDLEPKPADADPRQLEALWEFRQNLRVRGVCFTFTSRREFELLFRNHLAQALNAFEPPAIAQERTNTARTTVTQKAKGKNITQVAGDYHNYPKPRRPKIIVPVPDGSVSPAELKTISMWIEDLVENTVGLSRSMAFGMYRNRLKNHFALTRTEQLLSTQMPDVQAWYKQQLSVIKRGWKTKDPDTWRKDRYGAIHGWIQQMGVDKIGYYSDLAKRLRMKKPFTSLTQLTKRDLERVARLAYLDVRRP